MNPPARSVMMRPDGAETSTGAARTPSSTRMVVSPTSRTAGSLFAVRDGGGAAGADEGRDGRGAPGGGLAGGAVFTTGAGDAGVVHAATRSNVSSFRRVTF